MTFKKILLALPIMFSLTACSCQNKIKDENAAPEEITTVNIDVVESDFFKGKVSDRVFFATDKSTLNHEAQETLKTQASLLRGQNVDVVVEGHCDERGTRNYNLALGARRANFAKDALCKHGVDCHNVTTVSYGKDKPPVNPSDWDQNRTAITVVNKK